MNRVHDYLKQISDAKVSLERLEMQYEGKPRGTIYRTTVEYQKKRAQDFLKKLTNFGSDTIHLWKIRGIQLLGNDEATEIGYKQELYLRSDITEDEIIDRMSLSGYKVESLELVKKIKLGFPRITKKT